MADTKKSHAGALKSGSYVIFDGIAYIVKSVQISKTGKHGHAKARIEAISIMDSKKVIKLMPGHDAVDIPIIEKKNAQVLSLQGDKASVMDMDSYETFDMHIPDDMKDQVKEGSEILYWTVMNDKLMKQVKN
ncbi:MAG: translation initiation factor IF-5A [archaeon]